MPDIGLATCSVPNRSSWRLIRDAAGHKSGYISESIGDLLDDWFRALGRPIPKDANEDADDSYQEKVAAANRKIQEQIKKPEQKAARDARIGKTSVALFLAATKYAEKLAKEKGAKVVTYRSRLNDEPGKETERGCPPLFYGIEEYKDSKAPTPFLTLLAMLNYIRSFTAKCVFEMGVEGEITEAMPQQLSYLRRQKQFHNSLALVSAAAYRKKLAVLALPPDTVRTAGGGRAGLGELWDVFLRRFDLKDLQGESPPSWAAAAASRSKSKSALLPAAIDLYMGVNEYLTAVSDVEGWGKSPKLLAVQEELENMKTAAHATIVALDGEDDWNKACGKLAKSKK